MRKAIKKHQSTIIVIVTIVVLLFLGWCFGKIDFSSKIKLTDLLGGAIATTGLFLFWRRNNHISQQTDQQRQQIDLQIQQRVDERFNSAISLLGSDETSARTGAIYALFELAIEENKYRKQTAQILCSHIRSKTQESESESAYQTHHKDRPSNEIQTCIDLLTKDVNGNKGLYCQEFAKTKDFPKANFTRAYLIGANFDNAQCQGAVFNEAKCQRAKFWQAQCQNARFIGTQCQAIDFQWAQFQWANFTWAQFQGADFTGAQFQRASFVQAQCQGVNFDQAQFQQVFFANTQCQGVHKGRPDEECIKQNLDSNNLTLEDCIGRDTNFSSTTFAGELTQKTITAIENARLYLGNDWHQSMQQIIQTNKNKANNNIPPIGIIQGVLEDSEELQAIIAKDWGKLKQIQSETSSQENIYGSHTF